jgi:pilus assembly protein CpaC
MKTQVITRRARLGTALAAVAAGLTVVAVPAPVMAQPRAYTSGTYRPSTQVLLSVGEGQMISLPRSVASVWTSNPKVADVYVNSPKQINLFGKEAGEATVIATAADGTVVYGANVRVNQNISSINEILHQAMPGSDISVTTIGQVAVLNGTVASPDDAAQAEMLVRAVLNPGVDVTKPEAVLNIVPVSRLKVATPLQVMLKVRIAEINRTALKAMGVNLFSSDASSGFKFGIGQGAEVTTGPTSSPFKILNPILGGRRSAPPATCSASTLPARSTLPRATASLRSSPSRTSPRSRAKPPASSPAASSRSRYRRGSIRSPSSTSNMASGWRSPPSSSRTAVSRCGSGPRSAS